MYCAVLIIPDISEIFKRGARKYNKTTSEVVSIITYGPLWETMRRKGITTHALIKDFGFSRGTLDSLKQGRNISTTTLNTLCEILDCRVEDVLEYVPDDPQDRNGV